MPWVTSAIAGTLAANVALVGVFLFLLAQDRERAPRHLRWWTWAWVASFVRYLGTLVLSLGGGIFWQLVELLFALLSGWLLVKGTAILVHKRCPWSFHGAFAGVGLWTVGAVFLEAPFLARTTPTFVLLGIAMIGSGIGLWRSGEGGRFGRLAGALLAAWGVHRLDYPLLRPIEGLAPFGFSLAMVLEQLTAVSFVLVHVEGGRARLRASEERYRGLVEDAPVGIFRTDAQGRLLDASPRLLGWLGVDAIDGVVGEVSARWQSVFEAVREHDGATVELAFETGEGVRRLAVQGRKLGEGAWQGVAQDVTQARAMEERLRSAERLEALGRLAGGVAHDFNNVLAVIETGVSVARDPRLPDERRERVLADVSDAVARGTRITRQLLTLSRFRGVRERFDLAAEVQRSARFLRQLVGDTVQVVLDLGPVFVEAERVHVEQILMNLATNARDAMPSGGKLEITVTRVDEGEPTGEDPPLPWAVLRVRDEGTGMDEATLARIFETFFTTKGGRGTGLGLATVRVATASSGGAIRVHSRVGEGTTFEVIFAAVEASS